MRVVEWSRLRGRPKLKWLDKIEADLKEYLDRCGHAKQVEMEK